MAIPKEIIHKEGDTYLVIGFYYNSTKRFRDVYSNPRQALSINLWNGRVYQVRNGKRKLIKEVVN